MAGSERVVAPGGRLAAHRAATASLAGLGLGLSSRGAGVVLGRDRHGAAVVLDLFRRVPLRLVLVGGARCAQLVAVRAAATGARIVVHSGRAGGWVEAMHRFGLGPDTVVFDSGGPLPTATRDRPQLFVVDTGPGADPGVAGTFPWRTSLVVRDELGRWDVDLLAGADHALLQPLTEAEAALAAPALGIGQARDWLSRTPPDMLAVVGRGSLRWVQLRPTGIETETLGTVARGPI